MKCPKCGCENPEEANFCCECGTKIESKKFLCPKCRALVKEGTKHCTNCGNSLNWVNVDYDTIPIPVQSAIATPK